MDLTFATFLSFARTTVRSPRDAARQLLALGLPAGTSWLALAVVCLLSSLLFHLSLGLVTLPTGDPELTEIAITPMGTVFVSALALLILVFAVHLIGRLFGGKGDLAQAALLIAWLQAVFLILQAVQVLALLILPPLADIIGSFGLILFLWLLAPFVTELHGFTSPWKVLFGIIFSAVGLAFLVSFLFVFLVGV